MEIFLNINELTWDKALFTKIFSHELLHHWWTHFMQFDKLKWYVIREKKDDYGYNLGDEFGRNSPPDCYDCGCSTGDMHEMYNPQNKYVCTEQNKYNK
jgi:hypothetical protein